MRRKLALRISLSGSLHLHVGAAVGVRGLAGIRGYLLGTLGCIEGDHDAAPEAVALGVWASCCSYSATGWSTNPRSSASTPYPDGELPVNEEAQWYIADLIRKHKPDVILTHWKGSFHRDHNNTHDNVMASLFFAGLKAFKREYPEHSPSQVYFAENWEDEEGFRPELYIDVTEVWDRYLEAIHAYSLFRGEVVSFRYEQWYDGASRMRGAEAGCDRAVALMRPSSYYSVRQRMGLLEE